MFFLATTLNTRIDAVVITNFHADVEVMTVLSTRSTSKTSLYPGTTLFDQSTSKPKNRNM